MQYDLFAPGLLYFYTQLPVLLQSHNIAYIVYILYLSFNISIFFLLFSSNKTDVTYIKKPYLSVFVLLSALLLYCSANHQLDGCLPEPANKVCSSDPPSVIQSVRLSGRHASSQSLLLAKSTSIPLLTFFLSFLFQRSRLTTMFP